MEEVGVDEMIYFNVAQGSSQRLVIGRCAYVLLI